MKKVIQSIEAPIAPLVPIGCELSCYIEEITECSPLSIQQECDLGSAVRKDCCPVARAQLLRANLRLVVPIAKQFADRGVSLRELIEEGNTGLAWAVQEFDPEQGVRFSTLASWWIKHAIRRIVVKSTANAQ